MRQYAHKQSPTPLSQAKLMHQAEELQAFSMFVNYLRVITNLKHILLLAVLTVRSVMIFPFLQLCQCEGRAPPLCTHTHAHTNSQENHSTAAAISERALAHPSRRIWIIQPPQHHHNEHCNQTTQDHKPHLCHSQVSHSEQLSLVVWATRAALLP
jgi:hypothetical protein